MSSLTQGRLSTKTLTACCVPASTLQCSTCQVCKNDWQSRAEGWPQWQPPRPGPAAGVALLEGNHHHTPEWEQGLLDQLQLQDAAAAEANGHHGPHITGRAVPL